LQGNTYVNNRKYGQYDTGENLVRLNIKKKIPEETFPILDLFP